MSDLWEIAEYVENHPDNHKQRWRLAKKLFKAWEYRLALEHLMVLKNEWPARVNVRRYLAATYYRLKRYDEAIAELNDAIVEWPSEIGLHEQLARALSAADQPLEASEVWSRIKEMDPGHPFASRATRILKEKALGNESPQTVSPGYYAFATPPPMQTTTDVVCANCGAANGNEFERCWQCHTPLSGAQPYRSTIPPRPPRLSITGPLADLPWAPIVSGLAAVLLLASLIFTYFAYLQLSNLDGRLPVTLNEFLLTEFFQTKVLIGVLLLIAWPVVLWLGLSLTGADNPDDNLLFVTGLLLATLTYALFWWPMDSPWLRLFVPLALSLVLILFAMQLPLRHGIAIWAFQAITMLAVALTPVAAIHGFGLVKDLPALARIIQTQDTERSTTISGETPLESQLTLHESLSPWLDQHATTVQMEVTAAALTSRTFIEILDNGRTVEFEQIQTTPHVTIFHQGDVEKTYTVLVRNQGDPVQATLTVQGIPPLDLRLVSPPGE